MSNNNYKKLAIILILIGIGILASNIEFNVIMKTSFLYILSWIFFAFLLWVTGTDKNLVKNLVPST